MTEPSPLIAVPLTMSGSTDGLVCGPDGCAVPPFVAEAEPSEPAEPATR